MLDLPSNDYHDHHHVDLVCSQKWFGRKVPSGGNVNAFLESRLAINFYFTKSYQKLTNAVPFVNRFRFFFPPVN